MQNQETDRVRRNTDPAVNQRIDEQINQRLRFYAVQPAAVVSQRIAELDAEWSVERIVEVKASSVALTGIMLSLTGKKRWLALSTVALGFLLLQGIHGWCPPVVVLRRLGVRTGGEIERERYALRFLRGDFRGVKDNVEAKESVEQLLKAVAS
jgi:hypothetical protein